MLCQFWQSQNRHHKNECGHNLVSVAHKALDHHLQRQKWVSAYITFSSLPTLEIFFAEAWNCCSSLSLAAICSCMHGPHLSQVHLPDQRMNLLQQDGHRWIGEGLIITILYAFWFYNLSITIFYAKTGWSCAFHSILQNIYPGTGSYAFWRKGDQCSLSSLQPTYYFSIEKDLKVLSTLKQLLRLVWIMWKNV